jgi:sarcosine oxidase subunit beta
MLSAAHESVWVPVPSLLVPRLELTRDLPASADLVVIGGGIVGAATAFFASRAGLRVVVIEKRPALSTLTTPVSTGAFRLQFDNADEIALVREGIALFEHFAELTGLDGYDLRLTQQGYLFCATSEAGVKHQRFFVEALHGWGVRDVELMSGEEARHRFPYLGESVLQARYRADDGWLDPVRLTHGYALASGAAFCVETTATGFEQAGERVVGVRTDHGTIACQDVVLAAGAFSARVARLAGVEIELRPTRRQKLILPELPEVPAGAPMTIEEETAAHWRPGLRGCYALLTDPTTPAGEPLEDVPSSSEFAFALLNPASPTALARVCPFWNDVWDHGTASWVIQAGQYDYTRDHRPLLGPTGRSGLHLNTGYSGHGIMTSAGGSRLVVDALLGQLAADANPFRPDRPMVDRPLDIL